MHNPELCKIHGIPKPKTTQTQCPSSSLSVSSEGGPAGSGAYTVSEGGPGGSGAYTVSEDGPLVVVGLILLVRMVL